MTGEPADGWDFVQWQGDVPPEGTEGNPLTLTMDGDKAVPAVFTRGVVPGVSIGLSALGDAVGEVDRALGPPDFVFADPDCRAFHFGYEDLGLGAGLLDIDRDRRVDSFEPVALIVATAPYAGAHRGAVIGSAPGAVEEVMGPAEEMDGDDHWYPTRGIVWTIEGGLVTMPGVFEPAAPGAGNARSKMSPDEQLDEVRELFGTLGDGQRITEREGFSALPMQ